MQYIITFVEGLISFISPCFLPMLPVYVAYFAGGTREGREKKTLVNALMFIMGFTLVFVALGVFAAGLGSFLKGNQKLLNIVSGALMILFGLSFLEIIPLKFFQGLSSIKNRSGSVGLLSSFTFGLVFSISLTPCVGAFLGSALALASSRGSVFEGAFLLLIYSLGLGLPLFISAALIAKLKSTFDFIKKHYKVINLISGVFLIITGILMILGLLDILFAVLS